MKPAPDPADSSAASTDQADAGAPAWLSALADGEAEALDAACRQWRDDASARSRWHCYHLIGDVMRSDELAAAPARDAAFLAGLRARLAAEPVVLAPQAATATGFAWRVPVAVAAGVVLVAGALLVARIGPVAPGVELARNGSQDPLAPGAALRPATDRQALLVDPRLDEFLRAHQAIGRGLPMAAPGAPLRRVELVVPAAAASR